MPETIVGDATRKPHTFERTELVLQGEPIPLSADNVDALAKLHALRHKAATDSNPWTFFECEHSDRDTHLVFELWSAGLVRVQTARCIETGGLFFIAMPK